MTNRKDLIDEALLRWLAFHFIPIVIHTRCTYLLVSLKLRLLCLCYINCCTYRRRDWRCCYITWQHYWKLWVVGLGVWKSKWRLAFQMKMAVYRFSRYIQTRWKKTHFLPQMLICKSLVHLCFFEKFQECFFSSNWLVSELFVSEFHVSRLMTIQIKKLIDLCHESYA